MQRPPFFCQPNLLTWIIIVLLGYLFGCNGKEETTQAKIKDITQAVYASGKVYPLDYYKATVNMPGRLQAILVKVGDSVKAGQPLFVIRNEVSELGVATARNNLELANINADERSAFLQSLQDDIRLAQTKYHLDSVNFSRYVNIAKEGAGTRIAYDQAQAQFQTSRETLRKAINSLNNARQRLQTEVRNARNQYRAQQSQQSEFTIHATLNGTVYDIMSKVGEYVNPQLPVMELGRSNEYEVELAIDETDINLVRAGMEVVYSTETFGNQTFGGVVTKVYPKISLANKSIKALASISFPAGTKVYAGSTIEANIIFARKKGALVLPKFFLNHDSVYVRKGGSKQKVKIKRGIEDVEFVEIVSGISAEDVVVKP